MHVCMYVCIYVCMYVCIITPYMVGYKIFGSLDEEKCVEMNKLCFIHFFNSSRIGAEIILYL